MTGWADTASGTAHAFLYSGGMMQDLGTLGGARSEGFGINAIGEVVGSAVATSGVAHAFLYSGGTMYDLNSLVVSGLGAETLYQATGINDRGQIVANTCGIVGTGCKAFRLDPLADTSIPTLSREVLAATALLLLASGLLLRRRRQQ